MNEHFLDGEKRLDGFVEWKRQRVEKPMDVSEDVMAKLLSAGKPADCRAARPRYTWFLPGALLRPAFQLSALCLVLAAVALFYFFQAISTSTETDQLAMHTTRTKGEAFKLDYLVQRAGTDTLQPASDSGVYGPEDRLQPFYWSKAPLTIYLVSSESRSKTNCLNCSSAMAPAQPAQGKPLPIAIELDDSSSPELLVAFAAVDSVKSQDLLRCIAACWQDGVFIRSQLTDNPICKTGPQGYWATFYLHKNQ